MQQTLTTSQIETLVCKKYVEIVSNEILNKIHRMKMSLVYESIYKNYMINNICAKNTAIELLESYGYIVDITNDDYEKNYIKNDKIKYVGIRFNYDEFTNIVYFDINTVSNDIVIDDIDQLNKEIREASELLNFMIKNECDSFTLYLN